MFRLSSALKAKGEQAEAAFRAWLNQSGVAFLYIEQSPLNVPAKLRGKIKRPDYLVGIPHAGMMAFDVKAKSAYDDHLIFEAGEVAKLSRFAEYFNLSLYFACLDLDAPECFYWVSLQNLTGLPTQRRGKAAVIAMPVIDALAVPYGQPFMDAFANLGRKTLETAR